MRIGWPFGSGPDAPCRGTTIRGRQLDGNLANIGRPARGPTDSGCPAIGLAIRLLRRFQGAGPTNHAHQAVVALVTRILEDRLIGPSHGYGSGERAGKRRRILHRELVHQRVFVDAPKTFREVEGCASSHGTRDTRVE